MAVPMSAESSSLTAVLQKHFGFSEFRLGQEPVIEALLEGRSALAVFPTGAGKSMCYQLPAILLDGLTLVISPLIALMEDQVGALKKRGVAAERLDSTRSYDEIREIYARVQSGEVKLLYVAPERLANEGFLRFLQTVSIALLAIDEAHCLSEWGAQFPARLPQAAAFFPGFSSRAGSLPHRDCDSGCFSRYPKCLWDCRGRPHPDQLPTAQSEPPCFSM